MTIAPNSDSARRIALALAEAGRMRASGQLEWAERICREVLAAHPSHVGALNTLALVMRDRGDPAEAEALFRKGITIAPNEASLHSNLGNLQRAHGDLAAAEASLRRAVSLRPTYPEAYYNLGVVLGELGRREEALAALRRATVQKAGYAEALVQIGVLLRELGKNEEALRSHDAAIAARPDYFNAHYYRAGALVALGRLDEAVAAYDRALELKPGSHEAHFARGNALARARRDVEALEAYRRTVEIAPDFVPAHRELNALSWSMGRTDLTFASYAAARDKVGDGPDLLLAEAEQRLRLRDGETAEELLKRARQVAPQRLDIANALGRALSAQRRFGESVAVLEDVSYRNPASADYQRDLAMALLQDGRPAEAMRVVERALASSPFDQLLLAFLALAYRELGDSRLAGLVDHAKYVRAYDLRLPTGFADAQSYNNALGEDLLRLHTRIVEPLDQSVRGGTQTMGELFSETSGMIASLKEGIDAAVADYIAGLPDDPLNPAAARKSDKFGYSGSWSCRLRSGGFHDNHVHHKGWISSAYYVVLPDAINDTSARQGWLKFGESNIALGERDRAEQLVQPAVGRLVLFPSYYWHGTVPFASSDARMTVAFDVVPAGETLSRTG
jgi:tetratricopeptide (TPR) repeat protein